MRPGFVLDVGCGIGRNLHHLGGTGVGVDHNPDCVETCRESGLTAFTTDQFALSEHAVGEHFDSLLLAHVVEHMTAEEAAGLVRRYLPFVRPDARTIIITPQQRGQRSDQTHVTYFDPEAIRVLAVQAGLEVESIRSFPFPRLVGRWFTHNETVSVLRRVSPR